MEAVGEAHAREMLARDSRRAHAGVDLRTDRDEGHEGAEGVDDERVALVAPIEADLLPEEARRDADPDLLARRVNNKGQNDIMGLTGQPLSSAQKKAVTMAALLELYGPGTAEVKKVKYLDDTDSNLVAAMELIPKMFPHIKFEFYDVVHRKSGRYDQELVAKTTGAGELKDAKGKVFGPDRIAGYKSADAPWKPDAAFEGKP